MHCTFVAVVLELPILGIMSMKRSLRLDHHALSSDLCGQESPVLTALIFYGRPGDQTVRISDGVGLAWHVSDGRNFDFAQQPRDNGREEESTVRQAFLYSSICHDGNNRISIREYRVDQLLYCGEIRPAPLG